MPCLFGYLTTVALYKMTRQRPFNVFTKKQLQLNNYNYKTDNIISYFNLYFLYLLQRYKNERTVDAQACMEQIESSTALMVNGFLDERRRESAKGVSREETTINQQRSIEIKTVACLKGEECRSKFFFVINRT